MTAPDGSYVEEAAILEMLDYIEEHNLTVNGDYHGESFGGNARFSLYGQRNVREARSRGVNRAAWLVMTALRGIAGTGIPARSTRRFPNKCDNCS